MSGVVMEVVLLGLLVALILAGVMLQRSRKALRDNEAALLAEQKAVAEARDRIASLESRIPRDLLNVSDEVERLTKEKSRLDTEVRLTRDSIQAEKEVEVRRAAEARSNLDAELRHRRDDWEAKFKAGLEELARLHKEIEGLNELAEMQSYGQYKPLYEFATAAGYKDKLEQLRSRQNAMIKGKNAAVCRTTWTVGGSEAEGRRMTEQQVKLMLRAFNGECDAAIASVTWKNVQTLQDRIRKIFETVNKLGKSSQVEIVKDYLDLKLKELRVAFEYADKLQQEKEEQRQIREQMKEEERAQKELEKAKEEAEKEERKLAEQLKKAQEEAAAEALSEKRKAELDARIAKIQELLTIAHEKTERAISQAQLTKVGHVYVLSNEGSFGPSVYKVGMTRRLDPQDRVNELGDASVPFPFDVHGMIFCDDAPGLEKKLHQALDAKRVNLVNTRKEYFHVTLSELATLVKEQHGEFQLTLAAEASEYRKSVAIRAEREAEANHTTVAVADKQLDDFKARFEALQEATQ